MKISSKDIAISALFVAIVAIMTFVPFLGMIPLVFLSVNIVLVPIIVCAQSTNALVGAIVSTAFGIFSCLRAYVSPQMAGITYFAVQNPLVSVLPRLVIGLVAFYSYTFFKKILCKNKNKDLEKVSEEDLFLRDSFLQRLKGNVLPSMISAFLGTLTNTVLFLGMLVLLYNGTPLETSSAISVEWAFAIVATNFIPEAIAACLLVPPITTAIERATKKRV